MIGTTSTTTAARSSDHPHTPSHRTRGGGLRTGLARLLASAALATGLLAAAAAPSSAHDDIVGSDPAADAALTAAPTAVVLTFSDDLLDLSTTVVVTGPDGPVATGATTVAGPTATTPLPAAMPDGAYTVAWRVVSSDGHPIEGTFAFSLDQPEQATPSPSVTPAPTPTATPTETATQDAATPAEPSPGETLSTAGPTPAEPRGSILPWAIGAAAVVAGAVAWLVLRRRAPGA
ncbi:MAG: copper resistance protein CopC [Cellulomonadaceae bacterium]|nr:copper resistance protein CopC [Cellulomonadaceae bacterium]